MSFIVSSLKKHRIAIPVSILWGCCFLLSIINQWSYYWRRSNSIQLLLSALILIVGASLFFISLKSIEKIYINIPGRKKIFLVLFSSIAGVFLVVVLFQNNVLSQYPYVPHTLIIRAIDKKNPASSSSEVKLLEIQVDGRQVEFRSLEQVGDWSKEDHMFRGRGQGMLTYGFIAGLDPAVVIQFETGPSAGLVQIEYENQEPIVHDLYSDQIGSTFFPFPPFTINAKHPLFLFVMLVFAVDYIVIFWLTLWLSIITYAGLRKYMHAGFRKYIAKTQKFIKELTKYVFQFSEAEEKTTYLDHKINRSSIARALVLLAPTCYFLYYVVQGKLLLLGNTDRADAQLPYLFAAKNALMAGQLPWWNPYIFNGTPIWGNPAIFLSYPFTWIELLTPRSFMLYVSTFICWLHYGGVFLAAFLYFRALIGDEKWSSFSALAYGFSISVAYGLSIGNAHLPVYVLLPLCLYILHTYGQRSLRRNIIYLILTLYCLITGGFLQLLIYAMAIIGSYVLFLAFQSPSRKEAFSLIVAFSGSLFVAALLSAPAWLSILNMAGLVSRVSTANVGLLDIYNDSIIAPINELLRLFMPNGFGFGMYVPPISYVETMVAFCGISSLFLAGAAIVCNPKKFVYYWFVVSATMLLFCFTKLVFIQNLIFGGIKIIPERLLFILPIGIASLAGLGGKALCERQISRRRILIFNPFNILLAIAIFSNLSLVSKDIANICSIFQQFVETGTLIITSSILPEFELIRAIVIILTLILLFTFSNRKSMTVLWVVSVLFLLFEVIPGTYLMNKVQLNPLMVSQKEPFFAFDKIRSPLPFSTSDLETFRLVITEKNPSRRENDAPPYSKEANQGSIYQYLSPWGYANGYSANLAALIQTIGAVDINTKCESGGLVNGTADILNNATRQVIFDPLCHPRLADLLSIGAVLKADADWQIIEDRRGQALPRANLFYDYEVISDSLDASNRLAEDKFDIHKTLIVEKQPSFDVGPADLEARSIVVKNTPNEVIINVQSNEPALLLLTDTYSPGWNAEIDHQPVEIVRSNVAFRSVWIPKGNHMVVFHYDPPGLTISIILGLFGVVVFVIIVKSKRLFQAATVT